MKVSINLLYSFSLLGFFSPLFLSVDSPMGSFTSKGVQEVPRALNKKAVGSLATTISGTVYLDDDGSYVTSDPGIGSVTLPTGATQQLYVYAVLTGTIEAKATVAANGAYSLTGLTDTEDYDIYLSEFDQTTGESFSSDTPFGHVFAADQDDDGTINLQAGDPDGIVNTASSGTAGTMTDINFWISAQTYTVSGTVYEDNTDNSTVDGSGTNAGGLYAYLVRDASDEIYYKTTVAGDGTYSFTAGASAAFDVIFTSEDLNVGDFQPDNPYPLPGNYAYVGDYDPESASFSNSGAIGNIDLNNLEGNITGADIGIRNGLSISGTIYEDADRATNGADGTGIGTVSGTQLYMYLYDDDTSVLTVLHKTTVNGDGTYSFSNLTNLDYEIYVSAENLSIGNTVGIPVDPLLPAGWIVSVEDENGSINTEDNINGAIDLGSIQAEDLSNINFGLTQVNYIAGSVTEDTDIIADNVGDAAVAEAEGAFLVYLVDASNNNVVDATFSLPISATTRSDGTYALNDVPTGTGYKIKLFEKAGFDTVADTDAVNDGADDSDTNSSTTDKEIPVDIVANETDTGNDFVVRAQEGASLDWEDQGISDNAEVPDNSDYAVAGVSVNVDWQVVDANGSMSSDERVSHVTYEAGEQGGDPGHFHLAMDNSENNQGDYIEVVFTFDVAVPNLEFDLLDVDIRSDGSGFIDAVEVFYNGSNNVRGTSFYSVSGVGTEEYTGGGLTGFQGKLPQSNGTETTGNIAFDFGSTSISDVTIRYYSAPGADSNPAGQLIGISDFHINPLYDISGIVYQDEDRLDDNAVDGTGIGAPDGVQLYAYLVDDDNNIIIAKETVAGDGTFTFADQSSGAAYDVEISIDNLNIGDGDPSLNFPTDWFIYGEYDPESATIDTDPGANVDLEALTGNITGVAFGIDKEAAAPIELLSFSLMLGKGPTVNLQWKTLTETNNDFFSVERSPDAEAWTRIGEVKGAGTTSESQSYHLLDEYPLSGTSYYRLKQTDYNGDYSYSSLLDIHILPSYETPLSLYPNPTRGLLTIEGSVEEIDSLSLFDLQGKTVMDQIKIISRGTGFLELDLRRLVKGIYLVKTNRETYKVRKE